MHVSSSDKIDPLTNSPPSVSLIFFGASIAVTFSSDEIATFSKSPSSVSLIFFGVDGPAVFDFLALLFSSFSLLVETGLTKASSVRHCRVPKAS